MDYYYEDESGYGEEEEQAYLAHERARAKLRAERRARRRRQRMVRRALLLTGVGAAAVLAAVGVTAAVRSANLRAREESAAAAISAEPVLAAAPAAATTAAPAEPEAAVLAASEDAQTAQLGEDISSTNAVLISLEDGRIVAEKGNPNERIVPASMTKILTVLVAADRVENLDDTFEITLTETDYSYENDCSNVGFEVGEKPTIRDLFYGTILCSGADAAVGLANYVAGSQEAFAVLMNEKLEELGIADSAYFTNAVGVYDEALYCTPYDMAVILDAAMKNDFLKEVLSAHTYTTSGTPEHPEGLLISNWFLRRIEDKDSGGGFVVGAKTGYVAQSGNCAASYATDPNGKPYICVTANASSQWYTIYDHAAIYKEFLPGGAQTQADAGSAGTEPEGTSGEQEQARAETVSGESAGEAAQG